MNETVDVVQSVADGAVPVSQQEIDLVRRLSKQVADARKADKAFRARVVRDRAVVDGRALEGFEVSAQLVAAVIDTLVPFIYAKDPDVDVVPEDQTAAPYKPRARPPQQPVSPNMAGTPASPEAEAAFQQQLMQYQQELTAYLQQQDAEIAQAEEDRVNADFVRRLGQTIEIVVSRLWRKARLKAEAKAWVRAGLTTGEGWLKVSLQGDLVADPNVQRELYELQEQLQAIDNLTLQIERGDIPSPDADRAALEAKIQGAQARLETYVGRCLAVDWVDTLDMQWPHSLRKITDYVRAPWGADCTYMSKEDVAAKYAIDPKRLESAACWRQPDEAEMPGEAASYAQNPGDGEFWVKANSDDTRGMLRVWELWSRADNMIYCWVDGCDFWARPPMAPRTQTTRFYPYFLWAPFEVDGTRHPQSLAGRLAKLQNEFALTRSNQAESRRRSKPGVLVDGTNLDDTQVAKMEGSTNQEYVVLKPLRPGELAASFAPKPYARVDPGLYDTTPISVDIETISGAADALRQGVSQPKTATQAEIEATGTDARTGYSRDALDMAFDELAEFTAELSLGGFPREAVMKWAGPHAVWPNDGDPEAISSLVYVAIRAGSSGKPNTSAERQAWSTVLPLLQGLIMQIAQFSGADPVEVSDKLKELLRETVARTGDRMDVDRFLPMGSPMAGLQGAAGGMPGAPMPGPADQAPGPSPAPPQAIN